MIDLSSFFFFLAILALCITVVLCFCIYFGVKFKFRNEEVEFIPSKHRTCEEKEKEKEKENESSFKDDLSDTPTDSFKSSNKSNHQRPSR